MTDTTAAPAVVDTPAAASAADAPAAQTAAAPVQTSFLTDLPEAAPAAATTDEAKPADAAKADEPGTKTSEEIAAEEAATASAAGAPETYADFSAPEGAALDTEVTGQFAAVAKELNLPQDKAQLLIDKMQPVIAKRQAENLAAMRADWAAQTAADPEFGGTNLQASGVFAARAMNQFATPALKELLNQSGLGDHPELVRFMVKAGKAISEEKIVTGGIPASGNGIRTAAEVLYPSTSVKKN